MTDRTPEVPEPAQTDTDFPPPQTAERSPDPQPSPARPATAVEPRPREGGFKRGFGLGAGLALGLGAVSVVASIVTGVMLLISALVFSMGSEDATSTTTETIWGSGEQRLRAIRIEGAIMADSSDGGLLSAGTYGYEIAEQLDELKKEDAGGVVLLVNTPGGSISGSKAISDAVQRYQERTGQKVLVHVSSMSASGGVYSTATADEIVADYGTLVGSIGVVMGPFTHYNGVTATGSTLLEAGVTTTGGVTSEYLTAGKGKDFGNPFREMTDEERKHYQAGIDAEYEAFVDHVSKNRDIPRETIINEFGAFIFDAQAAKANGLVDEVMGRDEFFRHAAEAAGLDPEQTRVEASVADSGFLGSLIGMELKRPLGFAPAVEQGAGVTPSLSSAICSGTQPLVYAGDFRGVCA